MTPTELHVGDTLEPLVIDAVDSARMKTMAAILQDPNPIHFDVDAVRRLGFGDRPINQGPINMGYLMNLVLRTAGDAAAVKSFTVRFMGNVFAGEQVQCTATVASVSDDQAELELQMTAGDRVVLAGSATVAMTP